MPSVSTHLTVTIAPALRASLVTDASVQVMTATIYKVTLNSDTELNAGPFLLTQSNPAHKYLVLNQTRILYYVLLTILMLTFNRGKTGITELVSHILK